MDSPFILKSPTEQLVPINDKPFAGIAEWEQQNVLATANHMFFGLNMSQHPHAVLKLNQLLNGTRPARIIEIGAGNGGLTTLFALYAKTNGIPLYAYDKTPGKHADLLTLLGFPVILKDALEDPATVEEIKALVASPGRTILFADAGKALEQNLYVPSMKVGDFVLMHDFAPSLEVFHREIKGQTWNWCESWYERVAEVGNKHNITYTRYFNDVVWSCGFRTA